MTGNLIVAWDPLSGDVGQNPPANEDRRRYLRWLLVDTCRRARLGKFFEINTCCSEPRPEGSCQAALFSTRLELKPKGELNLPGVLCRKDFSEGQGLVGEGIGQVEIRAIQQVERFGFGSQR